MYNVNTICKATFGSFLIFLIARVIAGDICYGISRSVIISSFSFTVMIDEVGVPQ